MRRLLTTSILASLGSLACGKDQSIPTILACADSTAKNLVRVIQQAADSVSQSIVASNKMLLRSGVDDPELVCQQFPDQVSGLSKTRIGPIETVRLQLQEDIGTSDTTRILEDLNELLQIADAAGLDDHTKRLMGLYGALWSKYQGETAVEAKKLAPVIGAIAQLDDPGERLRTFGTIVSNGTSERQAIELRQLREEAATKDKEWTAWQLKALVIALVFVVLVSIAAFYVMRRIRNAEQAKVNAELCLAQVNADAEEARANALCIDQHFLKSILTCLEGKYEEGDRLFDALLVCWPGCLTCLARLTSHCKLNWAWSWSTSSWSRYLGTSLLSMCLPNWMELTAQYSLFPITHCCPWSRTLCSMAL